MHHTSPGLNSTQLNQLVRWGKLDPTSDSPTRCSGCLANLIVITLLSLDKETIKKTSFMEL